MTPRMLLAVRAWPWVLALLVLFPVLLPGHVLSYDMVFVPDLAMRSDFLGLGSGLPRAVPSDAVVAVLDEVLPGMLLQKVLLVGTLVLAGAGARRLVPAGDGVAQLAATSLYVWNPYVAERLGIGHWTVLLAYAALPWIVDAARRLRAGEQALAPLTLWLALTAMSPSGGVVGAVAALVLVAGRHREALSRTAVVAATALLVNLPWLVSGFLHAGAARTDPDGVVAFAARAEGLLPLPLTLLGLGGVWNAEVVPVSRLGWSAVVLLVVVAAVAAVGLRGWWAWLPRRDALGLALLGVVGCLVGLAGAVAPGVVADLVAYVPGAGLFRDGSRFLLLLAPLEASLFGIGASALLASSRERVAGVALAAGAILAPVALMPDMSAGLAGDLQPVEFPAEYEAARSALAEAAEHASGDVLVLPFTSYRLPDWNEERRTLDPLGRYLTPNYLASDDLFVSGLEVAGEDERASRVERLLGSGGAPEELAQELRAEGVRWVVVDLAAMADLAAHGVSTGGLEGEGDVVWEGASLAVRDLGGPIVSRDATSAELAVVAAAWAAALGAIVVAAGHVAWRLARRRRRDRPHRG